MPASQQPQPLQVAQAVLHVQDDRQNCHWLVPQQRKLFPSGPVVPGRIRRHSITGWHAPHVQDAPQTSCPQLSPFAHGRVAPGAQASPPLHAPQLPHPPQAHDPLHVRVRDRVPVPQDPQLSVCRSVVPIAHSPSPAQLNAPHAQLDPHMRCCIPQLPQLPAVSTSAGVHSPHATGPVSGGASMWNASTGGGPESGIAIGPASAIGVGTSSIPPASRGGGAPPPSSRAVLPVCPPPEAQPATIRASTTTRRDITRKSTTPEGLSPPRPPVPGCLAEGLVFALSRPQGGCGRLRDWRSGRVVEGSGLEIRRARKGSRGSNPFSSAR